MSEAESYRQAYKTARVRILGNEDGRQEHKTPVPGRTSGPVIRTGAYTPADYEAESFAFFAEGGDPGKCPSCGRTGFYGPRFAEPNQKYRSCRFCGFWQDVGKPPVQYLPTVHQCDSWPEVSRAAYIWWVAPDIESYPCPFCGESVAVALSLAPVPNEDPDHPWWKIPQGRTQSFYQRLWQNWEGSAGRTIL